MTFSPCSIQNFHSIPSFKVISKIPVHYCYTQKMQEEEKRVVFWSDLRYGSAW